MREQGDFSGNDVTSIAETSFISAVSVHSNDLTEVQEQVMVPVLSCEPNDHSQKTSFAQKGKALEEPYWGRLSAHFGRGNSENKGSDSKLAEHYQFNLR